MNPCWVLVLFCFPHLTRKRMGIELVGDGEEDVRQQRESNLQFLGGAAFCWCSRRDVGRKGKDRRLVLCCLLMRVTFLREWKREGQGKKHDSLMDTTRVSWLRIRHNR